MARDNGKALARREDAPVEEFNPQAALGAVRPDWLEESREGAEGITKEDVRVARIGIAQGLSSQITPDDPTHIDGLALYDLFNDLTGQVYGRGPIYFMVADRWTKRIEFGPDRKGVVDMDVQAFLPSGKRDPRTEWSTNEKGERIPPAATKYNEFLVMILMASGPTEHAVLSIKDTNKLNRKAATDLNGFILRHSQAAKPVPIWGVIYSVQTETTRNDKGTFAVPVIKQVGFVPHQKWADEAKALRKSLEGKNIKIEREPGDETENDDPLDPKM